MSLTTAGIYHTISRPPLSGAMEDCSVVRVQQLQCSIAKGAVCPRHDVCSARCGTCVVVKCSMVQFVKV